MRRATSNISTLMRSRSAPDRAINRVRTISAISGGVSIMVCIPATSCAVPMHVPVRDVFHVAAGTDEVLHVAQLQFGVRILRPPELRDGEVFFADNLGGKVLDGDALPALELGAAVGRVLADDAVHFDDAHPMDEVENGFVRNDAADGVPGAPPVSLVNQSRAGTHSTWIR
jgi:hypothetical protein